MAKPKVPSLALSPTILILGNTLLVQYVCMRKQSSHQAIKQAIKPSSKIQSLSGNHLARTRTWTCALHCIVSQLLYSRALSESLYINMNKIVSRVLISRTSYVTLDTAFPFLFQPRYSNPYSFISHAENQSGSRGMDSSTYHIDIQPWIDSSCLL